MTSRARNSRRACLNHPRRFFVDEKPIRNDIEIALRIGLGSGFDLLGQNYLSRLTRERDVDSLRHNSFAPTQIHL